MALSKTQTVRLGGLLSVMFKEESIPSEILNKLIKDELVKLVGNTPVLTDLGNDERRRLSTLCGLNVGYKSEQKDLKDSG